MQRKKTFLVVCFSIVTGPLWAQIPLPPVLIKGGLTKQLPARTVSLHPDGWILRWEVSILTGAFGNGREELRLYPGETLWAEYGSKNYLSHLGIVCKEELRLENRVHIPVRLRLGSLQEVNRLEGKPGW